MFTVSIQSERWNQQVGALHDALIGSGQMGDAARMIYNEVRSCMRRLIAITPPRSKKQGEEAVERDLNKIFTPVNEEFLSMVGSQFGVSGIDTWITGQDDKKPHLQWDKLDPPCSLMASFPSPSSSPSSSSPFLLELSFFSPSLTIL